MRLGLIGTDSSHGGIVSRQLQRRAPPSGQRIVALWVRISNALALWRSVAATSLSSRNRRRCSARVDGAIGGRPSRRSAFGRTPRRFLEAGLPVFIDKPLANRPRDAEALVTLARAMGRLFAPASALPLAAGYGGIEASPRCAGRAAGGRGLRHWYPREPNMAGPIFLWHSTRWSWRRNSFGRVGKASRFTGGAGPRRDISAGPIPVQLAFRPLVNRENPNLASASVPKVAKWPCRIPTAGRLP